MLEEPNHLVIIWDDLEEVKNQGKGIVYFNRKGIVYFNRRGIDERVFILV